MDRGGLHALDTTHFASCLQSKEAHSRTDYFTGANSIGENIAVHSFQLVKVAPVSGVSCVVYMCRMLDAGYVLHVEQRLVPIRQVQIAV